MPNVLSERIHKKLILLCDLRSDSDLYLFEIDEMISISRHCSDSEYMHVCSNWYLGLFGIPTMHQGSVFISLAHRGFALTLVSVPDIKIRCRHRVHKD